MRNATAGGTAVSRNGLLHEFNVQLTIQFASSSVQYVTGLGNMTNFFFEDAMGDRVIPEYYSEVNATTSPGVFPRNTT